MQGCSKIPGIQEERKLDKGFRSRGLEVVGKLPEVWIQKSLCTLEVSQKCLHKILKEVSMWRGKGQMTRRLYVKLVITNTKKEGPMKSHITRQHVKKQKATETVVVTKTEEEALAALEEWNRPRPGEGDLGDVDKANANANDTPENDVIVINEATGQEGNLEQAVERIKCLEEDLAAKEEVIKKIESELVTAKDLADIAEGTALQLKWRMRTLRHKSRNIQESH